MRLEFTSSFFWSGNRKWILSLFFFTLTSIQNSLISSLLANLSSHSSRVGMVSPPPPPSYPQCSFIRLNLSCEAVLAGEKGHHQELPFLFPLPKVGRQRPGRKKPKLHMEKKMNEIIFRKFLLGVEGVDELRHEKRKRNSDRPPFSWHHASLRNVPSVLLSFPTLPPVPSVHQRGRFIGPYLPWDVEGGRRKQTHFSSSTLMVSGHAM